MKINYFIPHFLLDVLRLTMGVFKTIRFYNTLKKNKIFKDSKKGKTVFVIANGPSLINYDHKKIKDKDVIVMNNFDLCSWKSEVNIVAHCIGEPINSSHWGNEQIEISNRTNSKSYWYHYSVKNDIYKYENKKNWELFHFVAPIIPEGIFFNRNFNLSSCTLGYSTTAQMSLMLAIYMGYSQINLIGFDHDMLKNRNVSPHFYQEGKGALLVDKSNETYISIMRRCLKMWNRYYKIKYVADFKKIKITNLTKNTYLDVF